MSCPFRHQRGDKADIGRKLVSAVEDLSKQSLALVPDLIEALSDLAVSVSNAVDLAVQVS